MILNTICKSDNEVWYLNKWWTSVSFLSPPKTSSLLILVAFSDCFLLAPQLSFVSLDRDCGEVTPLGLNPVCDVRSWKIEVLQLPEVHCSAAFYFSFVCYFEARCKPMYHLDSSTVDTFIKEQSDLFDIGCLSEILPDSHLQSPFSRTDAQTQGIWSRAQMPNPGHLIQVHDRHYFTAISPGSSDGEELWVEQGCETPWHHTCLHTCMTDLFPGNNFLLFVFRPAQKHLLDIFPKTLWLRDWGEGCTWVLKVEATSPQAGPLALFPSQHRRYGCPGNSCLRDPPLCGGSCHRCAIGLL